MGGRGSNKSVFEKILCKTEFTSWFGFNRKRFKNRNRCYNYGPVISNGSPFIDMKRLWLENIHY